MFVLTHNVFCYIDFKDGSKTFNGQYIDQKNKDVLHGNMRIESILLLFV